MEYYGWRNRFLLLVILVLTKESVPRFRTNKDCLAWKCTQWGRISVLGSVCCCYWLYPPITLRTRLKTLPQTQSFRTLSIRSLSVSLVLLSPQQMPLQLSQQNPLPPNQQKLSPPLLYQQPNPQPIQQNPPPLKQLKPFPQQPKHLQQAFRLSPLPMKRKLTIKILAPGTDQSGTKTSLLVWTLSCS